MYPKPLPKIIALLLFLIFHKISMGRAQLHWENNEDMINDHIFYFSVFSMSFVYPYLIVLANDSYANLNLPKNV